MAVLKCKMCGGDLDINAGVTVVECEYCGTKQTVPCADDEKKITLFGRANRLRFACEFDKAAVIYESIIADFPEEAEAYWGLVLCKYGIEYVDDPATAKKIPTCHRSSFDPVLDDSNFDLVLENADVVARSVYREEAKQIEELRKGIIEVSSKEEPYDIFICYKETAENGDRTVDSVIAQDVYTELVGKGYRVFFSRITLEDKLGQEYEPYIFAALNSAKIMLAFGTNYEYYNAVWVKNEWSRFLQLIAKGEKKTLIPCYKDIDAYDMPKEFARLQAQDMGKVGAIQDLLRGIEKILPRATAKTETFVTSVANANTASLLKRAFMFLEDEDWNSADEYCEKVLDISPQCAEAYLGKLMAELHLTKREHIVERLDEIEDNKNFEKAFRFADEEFKQNFFEHIYSNATKLMKDQKQTSYKKAAALFDRILVYKDSKELKEKCFVCIDRLKEYKNQKAKDFKGLQSLYTMQNILAIESNVVGLKTDGTVVVAGHDGFGEFNVDNWKNIVAIAAGYDHFVGLTSDGSVIATGSENDFVCNWEDIVAIATGFGHTVGLKSDGSVVMTNSNILYERISTWKNIISVVFGASHIVGLKNDGTVVAVGDKSEGACNVQSWKDIVAIATGFNHTVGLKSDGTVVATGHDSCGQCDVKNWKNVVAIYTTNFSTIGLMSNGTVVTTKDAYEVDDWDNIISLSVSDLGIVGLKADGTVVATGENKYGQFNVEDWKDIVDVFANANHTVGLKADGTVVVTGDNKDGQCDVENWKCIAAPVKAETIEELQQIRYETVGKNILKKAEASRKQRLLNVIRNRQISISAGSKYTIGLKYDGTVVAVGDNRNGVCNVQSWKDIVAVSASGQHTVGLKSDGTVVAVGSNDFGQCNVQDWKGIVAVSAGDYHTVGLKSDGTVVAVGSNDFGQCNVQDWKDIATVSASSRHTVGLKYDGTVVAVGDNEHGECNIQSWKKDVVEVAVDYRYTVGLKADGTVVATGENRYGQLNVQDWKDIVAIATGFSHTVGLKSDGTVVAVGDNEYSGCNVQSWKDIVAISAGTHYTVGLKSDGTVVAVGSNYSGECNIQSWKDIVTPLKAETLEELQQNQHKRLEEARMILERRRKEQEAKRNEELRRIANYRSQNLCQHCGGTFKGIFTKKCSVCGKEKDY